MIQQDLFEGAVPDLTDRRALKKVPEFESTDGWLEPKDIYSSGRNKRGLISVFNIGLSIYPGVDHSRALTEVEVSTEGLDITTDERGNDGNESI